MGAKPRCPYDHPVANTWPPARSYVTTARNAAMRVHSWPTASGVAPDHLRANGVRPGPEWSPTFLDTAADRGYPRWHRNGDIEGMRRLRPRACSPSGVRSQHTASSRSSCAVSYTHLTLPT